MSKKRKDKKGRVLKDNEYQRRDGKYEFKFVDIDGRRKSLYSWRLTENDITPAGKRQGPTLRELEKNARANLNEGIVAANRNSSLNEFFELYMKIHQLGISTAENYRYMWKRFIEGTLGRLSVSDIRKSTILRFYSEMHSKELSNGTIRTLQKMICPALQIAVEDHIIRENPANGCCKDYGEEDTTRQALTKEEEKIFLNCVREFHSHLPYELLFRVMLGTACRIGEITGLTWNDVDMEQRTIQIDHAVLYRRIDGKHRFYASTPKTRNGIRMIPMTNDVYQCLAKLWEDRHKKPSNVVIDGYSDFVFTSTIGTPINPRNINTVIYKIVNRYNKTALQPLPHISCHILRHTACTRMAEAGVDMNTLQYIMGHGNLKMIARVYDHVNLERARNQMAKVDAVQMDAL